MDKNPTIVNLAEIRSGTSSTTASTSSSPEQRVSSQATPPPISRNQQGFPPQTPVNPAPSDPSGSFNNIAVWAVIVFIISWLAWLSNAFYTESKELNNKISENQKQVMQSISDYQMDLKNQISDFERRHEADMRELQKMILQSQNHNSTQN